MRNGQKTEDIANIFKALGNPNRLRIYGYLLKSGRPENVSGLEAALGIKQSHLSQSLNILNHIGLVSRERSGSKVNYSINKNEFADFHTFNRTFFKKRGI